MVLAPCSYQQHADESAHKAYGHSPSDLGIGVLAEDETGGADHATEEHGKAQPPRRVEGEDKRECHQCANHSARSGSVGADLDARVDDGADYLDGECSAYHAESEARHVDRIEQVEQGGIADDAHDVGHETSLAATHLVTCPSVDLAVGIDGYVGQEQREEVDHEGEHSLRRKWQHVEITKHEEHDEGYHRQVEGCIEHRYGLGGHHK